MNNNVHIILFSTILAVLCSILLFAATQFTQPYRLLNKETDKDRNFLSALGVSVDSKLGARGVMKIFDDNIKVKTLGEITIYEYIPKNSKSKKPVAIAVPFSGPGFWAPIKGALALEPDLLTIKGIRFYQQEETPGLGGEIASSWFQNEFKGKKIVSKDGVAGFKIVKGDHPTDINSVDAITGATRTSERVQVMVDKIAKAIDKERSKYVR